MKSVRDTETPHPKQLMLFMVVSIAKHFAVVDDVKWSMRATQETFMPGITKYAALVFNTLSTNPSVNT